MSETSLKQNKEGYTSPDFMASLFKKPLYTPFSLTNIHTTNSLADKPLSPYKENQVSSLRVIENQESSSQNRSSGKLFRSYSLMEDERIHGKKYKLFFKTAMQGIMSEDEMNQLWDRLQSSLTNPYDFDKLLDQTKERQQKKEEVKEKQKSLSPQQSLVRVTKTRSKSIVVRMIKEKQEVFFSTPNRKVQKNDDPVNVTIQEKRNYAQTKATIKREMSSIKDIILENIKFLKKK